MWLLALNLGEILREFEEILGKYRILDESSVGSKGLKIKAFELALFVSHPGLPSLKERVGW